MRPPNIETAIRIFYEYTEIGNAEMKLLFGSVSSNTLCNLKKPVRDLMLAREVSTIMPTSVNTRLAYEAWGLDVKDMEQRYKRLVALGLRDDMTEVHP